MSPRNNCKGRSQSLIPAVGYLRRSSDKQETSLPEQRKAVEQYADEHGYQIIRWYTDDAISGDDTKNRKEFRRMIDDAGELRDFKAVLCWDSARFGRFDSIEYGFYVFPLREAGVHLATVMNGVTDWSEFAGRIVAHVEQEGKHQQLLDLSANVTRGQLEAANNGSWLGSRPYAYRIEGPKKQKRLVLDDPGKAQIVKRIFREYVEEGRPMLNIADRLNAEGILSPGGRLNGWRFDTVRGILENPAYTGDYAGSRSSYGKYHRIKDGKVGKSDGRTRNPKDEWIIRPDRHEAIIDRETFEKAQAILARGKTGRSPHTPETNPYVLSCLLRCGRCGSPLYGTNNGRHRYYECGNQAYNGLDACEGTTVREDKLLVSIGDYLESWLGLEGEGISTMAFCGALSPDDLPDAFEKVRKLVMPPERPKQDRERLENQAEQLKAKLEKARANLILLDAENIPAAQDRIRQLDKDLAAIEGELAKNQTPTERDVNAVALEVMYNLYSLAHCCRVLARPGVAEGLVQGVFERVAPAVVKRFLNRVSRIVCHTTKRGKGKGSRHVFQWGEIVFEGVGVITGKVNLTRNNTYCPTVVIRFGEWDRADSNRHPLA